MYSLRRVLAVRFSLTMLVALGLIAFWAIAGVRHILRQHIDGELEGILTLQIPRLASGATIPQQSSPGDFYRFFEDGNPIVALRDPRGVVVQSTVSDLSDFPLDTAAFLAALQGRTTWTDQAWREGRIRAVYAPARTGSAPGSHVLQVAGSLQPVAHANRDVLRLMAATVLLGTLAVAIGAFWLAGSAVAPVLEVAAQAGDISPETPQKRITAHADVSEYHSLIEVLNGLLDRCQRAFETQRRLLGDVGHELRTPLTVLRGEFEIALRSERAPRDYQLALRSGLEEIDRMTTMCDELLLITRANSHTLTLHRTQTDINDLIMDLVGHVRRPVEMKSISVSTRLADSALPVWADSELVSKMLDELVENAVKFSGLGGTVTIGTESADAVARLWVEDSGPGISPEQFPHLFEPFYRADEARTRSEGTGLGLCMAASIARAHGGTIRARNLPERGARFEVDLPLAAGESNGRSVRAA